MVLAEGRRTTVPAPPVPDIVDKTVTIDADYIEKHIGDLVRDTDLSRFIL